MADVVSGSKSSAALADLEERLGDLKQFFKNILNEKEEHSTEITKTYKKIENEIRQFRIKLDKRLDELETDLLKSLIDLEKGVKKGIVIVSDKLKTNEEKTLNLLNGITSMKHHASDLQVFFAIKEIEKEVEIEEHKAEELANNEELNIQTFSLTFNSKLPNLVATTESFGKISTKYLQSKIVYQRTKQKQAQIILENSIEKDLMLKNTFRVRRENYNWCGGTLVLPNNKVLLLEVPVYLYNRKIGEKWTELDDDSCEAYLVVLNQDGSLDRKVRVSSWSYSIAAINSKTVAVTSSRHPKIVIVNLQNKSVQKTINTKYPCYGIEYFNESLVYSCGENGIEMRNLISGKVTKLKIGNKTMYEHIAIHNEKIYISECWGHNGITCYDMAGNLIWRWEDNEVVGGISDLTVDKNSYVYGIGTNSTHLVIIFPNGRQSRQAALVPNRKLEQDDYIQPRKRHNSNLDEFCDSRGSSSEESLLDTIVKPSCSHAQPLQFSTKDDVDDLGVLSSKPLLDMAHAHDRLTKHFGKDGKEAKISNEFARAKALNFFAVMENTKDDIRTQSNTKNAEVVRKNSEILSSVIK
ncbi:Hypothetical predicted protein [Mytilus galloprovincialis]|uniref:Uncharacterized protein n=1 Tax=Mytilus galloprovincialis TaxID=29158 RepID=A0A8B6EBA5_MYTGA|nr:Hypothetical predicted protein [Mytilus galloprovincialis]